MKRNILIEKVESRWCWTCAHYKLRTIGAGRDKYQESTCEENLRLNALKYHPNIKLNFIDKEKATCAKWRKK